jgi:RNA polymerase sigma-70 factor (ECF subfamily)
MTVPDLEQVVRAAQDGDRKALRALFDRYQRPITAYCLVATHRDREAALDLTQEIFARAFGHLRSLTSADKFPGWLFAIAGNVCRDHGAAHRARTRLLEALWREQQADAPPRAVDERAAALRELIDGWPDDVAREIVRLKYGDAEHTTRAIAGKLHIPHGTVTVKLMRLRERLKRELRRLLLEDEVGR